MNSDEKRSNDTQTKVVLFLCQFLRNVFSHTVTVTVTVTVKSAVMRTVFNDRRTFRSCFPSHLPCMYLFLLPVRVTLEIATGYLA
jgi:hypothetical protein